MMIALTLGILFSVSQESTVREALSVRVLNSRGEWVRGSTDDRGIIRAEDGADLTATTLAWIPLVNDSFARVRPPFSFVRVNDGQIIVGSFGGFHDGDGGSVVRWKHPGLGLVDLPIDHASLVQLQPMAHPPLASESDEIVLRNGDRIQGFIEGFADSITIESSGTRHEVPIDRIAGIALVSIAPERGAVRVWLADGSVVDGSSIYGGPVGSFALAGVKIVSARPIIALPEEEILCVVRSPTRIFPLSSLSPTVGAPTSPALPRAEYSHPKIVSGDAPFSAPLGACAIEIRGPVRLIYEVPQSFSIFSALVEVPVTLRQWTDCTLVIRQHGRELARYAMNAKQSKIQLTVAIQSGPLEIEIEEGGGGPIGDTLILRRAIVVAGDSQG